MDGAALWTAIICGIVLAFCYAIRKQHPDPESSDRRAVTVLMIAAAFIGVIAVIMGLPAPPQN